MASCMYSKILPDYSDLDNDSGERPGFRLFIIENDGGISIQMQNAKDPIESDTANSVYMTVKEAKELLTGLNDAINRASCKNSNHKSRAKDIEN